MHDGLETTPRAEGQADRRDCWLDPAREALRRTLRAGASMYRRDQHLPGLIGMDPASLGDGSVAAAEIIVSRLRRALRAERRRANAGHWTYDLNRHIALRQAYAAESERMAGLRRLGAPDTLPAATAARESTGLRSQGKPR